MAKRYITYYGYFGPTSNVKAAPAALTGDVVARLLGVAADAATKTDHTVVSIGVRKP